MWKVQANHFEQSLFAALTIVVLATTATAQVPFDSGSDGTDEALDCAALFSINSACSNDCSAGCTIEIDLSLAAVLCDCDGGGILDDPCRWDCPSPVAGQGVYDAAQWAVVFKYTTIDIPSPVRVTFARHASGAPIVWLATGDVSIAGTASGSVDVSGNRFSFSRYATPGPGGFAAGAGLKGRAGSLTETIKSRRLNS